MFRQILRLAFILIISWSFVRCAGSRNSNEYSSNSKVLILGQNVFKTNCVSCHDLKDDGIGPRLGGVTSTASGKLLTEFIKNPSRVIDSGDLRAGILNRKYKMVMPPFDYLEPEQINAVLAYIAHESRSQNIFPLVVKEDTVRMQKPRLGKPVTKSGLTIELEDFIQIPPSADKPPVTRIANMRPHPSANGTLFVSDQRGIIYRLRNEKIDKYLDIRSIVSDYIDAPGLGTGLGSFTFHPDFSTNGLLYTTHTEALEGKKADYEYADSIKVEMQWVLSEWKSAEPGSSAFQGTKRELLRINVPGAVHGMQEIAFVPGIGKSDTDYGLLYAGIGDGGSTINRHPELCHHPGSLLGTIIRIDPLGVNSANGQYGIPVDNPFVKNTDLQTRKEIYAFGFRNPHRLSWDVENGKIMFSAEVGESNFEEVNVIVKGGDYGWNEREGAFGISPGDLKNVYQSGPADAQKFIDPFASYDHVDGSAISGGYVYHGEISALKDKYVFGDIVNGRLFYININTNLSDSTIHEITIVEDSRETNLVEMSGSKRVDLRVEFDPLSKEMFIMTKSDGRIRKIRSAFFSQKN